METITLTFDRESAELLRDFLYKLNTSEAVDMHTEQCYITKPLSYDLDTRSVLFDMERILAEQVNMGY